MARTRWLVIAVGVLAIGAAVWQFATGSGWGGFWLAMLGIGVLGRSPMRRYWEQVEANDPAAPALRASWMFAALALGGFGLGVTQLAGVGLAQNTFRGLLGLAAALFCSYWSARAARDHRRIRGGLPTDIA